LRFARILLLRAYYGYVINWGYYDEEGFCGARGTHVAAVTIGNISLISAA
jgi:hypothetical protein